MVVVREPEEIKTILNSDYSFEKPLMIYKCFFSYGLLTTGGDINKLHRKRVNPLFYPTKLQSYVPTLNAKVTTFLKRFDSNLILEEIEMSEHATYFAIDSMLATLFGIDDISEEMKENYLKNSEG